MNTICHEYNKITNFNGKLNEKKTVLKLFILNFKSVAVMSKGLCDLESQGFILNPLKKS